MGTGDTLFVLLLGMACAWMHDDARRHDENVGLQELMTRQAVLYWSCPDSGRGLAATQLSDS